MENDIKVAIVAIARLENDYINEWIEHHLDIGVNHIYIYDNSSQTEEKIIGIIHDEYLDRVTVIPAYNKSQFQMPAYKEAYEKFGKIYNYIIYIDIDEFIMLQKDKTINEFVERLPEDCECYRMNWEIYGDSDIVNRDTSSSVIKDFKKPSENKKRNTVTKSIIKGGLTNITFDSVHYAIRNKNGIRSNLKTYYGNMVDITKTLPIDKKSLNINLTDYTFIKLNHYITKSICEFICQKMRRPDAAWNYERNIDKDFFAYNKKTNEKIDTYNRSKTTISFYYWSCKNNERNYENCGDYYNNILINKLYNCICKPIFNDYETKSIDVALCGSILTRRALREVKYIIGCGLQNKKQPKNTNTKSYLAVRGKMTKKRLDTNGIHLSEKTKFIDPGLMVSKLYDFGKVEKKYKIGIIPHYIDEDRIKKKYGKQYHIISMRTCDVQMVCRKIMECEIILSSSLHGIIFSHSLGVPAYHIELNKMQDGDNFKFKDYYTCYDRFIPYKGFSCVDFNIPFEKIIEFDEINRDKYNPTIDEIEKKQNEFISILPYKDKLNKKFQINEIIKEQIEKQPEKKTEKVETKKVETKKEIKKVETEKKIEVETEKEMEKVETEKEIEVETGKEIEVETEEKQNSENIIDIVDENKIEIEQNEINTPKEKFNKIMKLREGIKKGYIIKTTDSRGKSIFLKVRY